MYKFLDSKRQPFKMINMEQGDPSPIRENIPTIDETISRRRHVGAENLQPPDIDEDAGVRGSTKFREMVDLEKGKQLDNDVDVDDKGDKSKVNKGFLCFGKGEKKKADDKPSVPWLSLVNFIRKPLLILKIKFVFQHFSFDFRHPWTNF